MRIPLLLLGLSCVLSAQDRYAEWGKLNNVCPRVEPDGPVRPAGQGDPQKNNGIWAWKYGMAEASPFPGQTTGGVRGAGDIGADLTFGDGTRYFKPSDRKSAAQFTAVDESGKATPMSACHGKPVVVGLWVTACEPSLFLLGEMGDLQKKSAQAGIVVFPVNYDPERWGRVNEFRRQSRIQPMLKGVTLYTPALGEQGVHQFMDVVPAMPMFFVLDREGRVAFASLGYKEKELVKCLKAVLAEPVAKVAAPAEATPAPAPATH